MMSHNSEHNELVSNRWCQLNQKLSQVPHKPRLCRAVGGKSSFPQWPKVQISLNFPVCQSTHILWSTLSLHAGFTPAFYCCLISSLFLPQLQKEDRASQNNMNELKKITYKYIYKHQPKIFINLTTQHTWRGRRGFCMKRWGEIISPG